MYIQKTKINGSYSFLFKTSKKVRVNVSSATGVLKAVTDRDLTNISPF